jgi:hypothetical protein
MVMIVLKKAAAEMVVENSQNTSQFQVLDLVMVVIVNSAIVKIGVAALTVKN